MLKRELTGYKKALEPDHPDTLAVVQNLGKLYHDRGKVNEAEMMFGQLKKALEPDLQRS
jgi:Tetratricopeptide repeat